MDQSTTPQAEMIVNWAVTDLCLEHGSQLRDHRKNGTSGVTHGNLDGMGRGRLA